MRTLKTSTTSTSEEDRLHRCTCIVNPGTESICADEIGDLLGKRDFVIKATTVTFDAGLLDIAKLCVRSQSITRALLLLCDFKASEDFDETSLAIEKAVKGLTLSTYLTEGLKYKVESRREGIHGFKSVDAARVASEHIKAKFKSETGLEAVPGMKGHELMFYLYVNGDEGYLGIDFSGSDIDKRFYKIFTHAESIRPSLAYCMLRAGGYARGKKVIDPFCGTGTIPIEAAYTASGIPVNQDRAADFDFMRFKFMPSLPNDWADGQERSVPPATHGDDSRLAFGCDFQLRHVRNASKNAAAGKVADLVEFRKLSIDSLDTYYEKGSFDLIVTEPPQPSKRKDSNAVRRVYEDFFHNADYILSDGGKIIFINKENNHLMESIKTDRFGTVDHLEVFQGKEKRKITVLERRG